MVNSLYHDKDHCTIPRSLMPMKKLNIEPALVHGAEAGLDPKVFRNKLT